MRMDGNGWEWMRMDRNDQKNAEVISCSTKLAILTIDILRACNILNMSKHFISILNLLNLLNIIIYSKNIRTCVILYKYPH